MQEQILQSEEDYFLKNDLQFMTEKRFHEQYQWQSTIYDGYDEQPNLQTLNRYNTTVEQYKNLETNEKYAVKIFRPHRQTEEDIYLENLSLQKNMQLVLGQKKYWLKIDGLVYLRKKPRPKIGTIMKLCEKNLTQVIEEGKKNKDFSLHENIFFDIFFAFSEFMDLGFLHRDIKPDNILVQGEQIYMIDFDGAINLLKCDNESYIKDMVGTKQYMSPEVLEDYNNNRCSLDKFSSVIENQTVMFKTKFKIKTSEALKFDSFSLGLTLLDLINCTEYERGCDMILNEQEFIGFKAKVFSDENNDFLQNSERKNLMIQIINYLTEWDISKRITCIEVRSKVINSIECPLPDDYYKDYNSHQQDLLKRSQIMVGSKDFPSETWKIQSRVEKANSQFLNEGFLATAMPENFQNLMKEIQNDTKKFEFEDIRKSVMSGSGFNLQNYSQVMNLMNEFEKGQLECSFFSFLVKLYTAQQFYIDLNLALGTNDTQGLQDYYPYLQSFYKGFQERDQEVGIPNKVYRGILIRNQDKVSKEFRVQRYVQKSQYFWPSFTSTSTSYEKAVEFMGFSFQSYETELPVIMEIELDPELHNSKMDVGKMSMFPSEQEILLLPYFSFIIQSKTVEKVCLKGEETWIPFIKVKEVEVELIKDIKLNIVWIDQNIQNEENQEYLGIFESEYKDLFSVQAFDDIDRAVQMVNESKNQNYYVITSGDLGMDVSLAFQDINIVKQILVFCCSVDYHIQWASLVEKISVVTNSFNDLIEIFVEEQQSKLN